MKQRLAFAVFAATLCLSGTSQANKLFAEVGAWQVSQDKEQDGLTACRAHYDAPSGSGHFIMAVRTNDVGYVSIDTPKGLTGEDTDALLSFGSSHMSVTATVYGKRLVFGEMGIDDINNLMSEGNFKWEAFDRSGTVDVGSDMVGEAVAGLERCVEESKTKQASPSPKDTGGNEVDSDALRLGKGCPKLGSVKSPPHQSTRKVTFYNQLAGESPAVTLYWLNPDGEPVEEPEIFDENGEVKVDTYDGAVYIAKDFEGKCYGGTFVIKPGDDEVYVVGQ